jgi:hypothetical protein
MMRVPARVAVAALKQLGFEKVSPDALRQWRHRGYLSPGRNYDLDEIGAFLAWRATRESA